MHSSALTPALHELCSSPGQLFPRVHLAAQVTTRTWGSGGVPFIPSVPLLQRPAEGEPALGAPTSTGPCSPLGSHGLNLGSLLQATWIISAMNLWPWLCNAARCSTRTIRQLMRSYFGLYETWRPKSCTELAQDSAYRREFNVRWE